jgi:hypothetical protein
MNPYLEQDDAWEDFHHNFITHAREFLEAAVGPNYIVKVEVRLSLHEFSAEERRFFGRTDVGVANPTSISQTGAPVQVKQGPVRLQLLAVGIERHASLEIRDRRGRRVVTAIELLSPSNKTPGSDRDDYLAKRRQILARRTHLVETDLRRGGLRPQPPDLPASDYYALLSRVEAWPAVDFWPIGLRERLPVVPIPLTAPDPDVHLDLQAVLQRTYDQAGYGKYIYADTPQPPLSAADEAWAHQILAASS